jgi:uncharacterized MnhB-related membrane protein
MSVMQACIWLLVAIAAPAVVLTRNPTSQIIGLSVYGLLFTLLFFIFQAPDVALSQVTVGAVAIPVMVMLALSKIRHLELQQREKKR